MGFESKITITVVIQKVHIISDIYKYVYIHLYAQRYSLIIVVIVIIIIIITDT